MEYSIDVYTGKSKENNPEVLAYYDLRKQVFRNAHGPEQDVYYGNYPTVHDRRENTVILVFKAKEPDRGEEIVFGGRRLVFPEGEEAASLPFEGKHRIVNRKAADRFVTLLNKDALDIRDVIPALVAGTSIKYAELGGFAIDQNLSRRLFSKEQYLGVRQAIYEKSIEAAKDAGVDIVVIGPSQNNLKHQEEWLNSAKTYEFRRLGKTKSIFSNPLPQGSESEILLINASGKYKLSGPGSILRFNQDAALISRNGKVR